MWGMGEGFKAKTYRASVRDWGAQAWNTDQVQFQRIPVFSEPGSKAR